MVEGAVPQDEGYRILMGELTLSQAIAANTLLENVVTPDPKVREALFTGLALEVGKAALQHATGLKMKP